MFAKFLTLTVLVFGLSKVSACPGCGPKDLPEYLKPTDCAHGEWIIDVNVGNKSDKTDIIGVMSVLEENRSLLSVSTMFKRNDDSFSIGLNRSTYSHLTAQEENQQIVEIQSALQKLKGISFICSRPVPAPRMSGSN